MFLPRACAHVSRAASYPIHLLYITDISRAASYPSVFEFCHEGARAVYYV